MEKILSFALSIPTPYSDRFCVSPQTFEFRQVFNRPRKPLQSLSRKILHGNQLHKIHHAESSAKPRMARRRQHVVWSRRIVARSLRRIVADKNRSCISDVWHIL